MCKREQIEFSTDLHSWPLGKGSNHMDEIQLSLFLQDSVIQSHKLCVLFILKTKHFLQKKTQINLARLIKLKIHYPTRVKNITAILKAHRKLMNKNEGVSDSRVVENIGEE